MNRLSGKKANIFLLFTAFLSTILLLTVNDQKVAANFEAYQNRCIVEPPKSDDKDDSGEGDSSEGDVTGDWTQEGTATNKVAKETFTYWGKRLGGAGAAGAVGSVGVESTFVPKIVQGGGTSDNPKEITGAVGTNGYGLYQVSPGSKYGNWEGYTEPTVENQSDYIWLGYGGAAIQNGLKNSPKAVKALTESKSPEEAAWHWYYYVENAGQSQGSYDKKADRESIARKAYEIFGGADIDPDSAIVDGETNADNGSDQAEQKKLDAICGGGSATSDAGESDSEIVNAGRKLLGWFHYELIHGEHHIGSVENPKKDGITDCSGFVWLVLSQCGYNTPENMGWYTQTMDDDAKGEQKYLKKISPEEAGAGDVVIVNTGDGSGGAGHTAILTEKWKTNEPEVSNTTKIIQMGGDPSASGVNEGTFVNGFLSLVNGSRGAHRITFARPVKK